MRLKRYLSLASTLLILYSPPAVGADRVTILYDAFGNSPELKKDWGFSALVEYRGKRVLFDTGNNAEIFAANVKALGVDIGKLDFVVISHRHSDHATGLKYLLTVNPTVEIYTPRDDFGAFGGLIPRSFLRSVESLPPHMRYFDGAPPVEIPTGTPWPNAKFVRMDTLTEIAPGIYVVPTISHVPGAMELRELSLSIRTPKGVLLVVGCSHAGIEEILSALTVVEKHVHLIVGGLHLVSTSDPEVARIATALRERWKVDRIAPGHCTGEPAFAALQRTFGEDYLYAGVARIIDIN